MSRIPHIKQFVDITKPLNQGFAAGQLMLMYPVDPLIQLKSNIGRDMAIEHARRTNKPIIFLNLEAT